MQFGVFSVSDITTDPTTGRAPSEAERIKAVLRIAEKVEEVGLDVFALGEHHNPPFFSSSPTTTLAHIAARTERLQLSTATTLITTNDPVKIAEDYAMLQHLADGRVDLMLGRGNTGPVYPWFGQDIRDGIPLADRELRAAAPALARGRRRLGGQLPHAAAGLHVDAAPAGRGAAVRLARLDPQPGDRRAGRLLRRRLLPQPHLLAQGAHPADGRVLPPPVRALRPRPRRPGDRRARRAGVHAAATARTPSGEFRPYFDNAPVYGHGPSLEDFSRETPLTVGSPQQVIERTLGFRDYVGDYQRQLFLVDHAGLPLKTVLEQLDILGEEVVPVLRREFAALKPAHVPDAPTHASLVAAAGGPATPPFTRRRRCHRTGGERVMATRTLAVVSAGLSVPSSTRLLADRLAGATVDALRERGVDATVEVVELREHARDLADNLVTGFPNASLRAALDTVVGADGLIAVTPIFSASYSGLFKTFFDVVDKDALTGKPVLLGATAGTARHSLALEHALRPLFAYLRTIVVPTAVFAAAQDWGAGDATDRDLVRRIERAAGELADLVARRPAAVAADPFATATPFEALLRGA